MKKGLLFIVGCLSLMAVVAQQGDYFTVRRGDYQKNVIDPWKYQVLPVQDTLGSAAISKIVFWRSEPLIDEQTKEKWRPVIRFFVYKLADSAFCKKYSSDTKAAEACEGAKKGGDYITVGNFILLNPDLCVKCVSSTEVDYCRNILNRLFSEVTNRSSEKWSDIVKQLPISSAKFKP